MPKNKKKNTGAQSVSTHDNNKANVKVCVNMIVKDEESNILRCLNSISHLIDAVAISDTGSKDNTIQLIQTFIQEKGLKGGVQQDEWTDDYGLNRTLALRYGERVCQEADPNCTWYLMFMDADDQCVGVTFDKNSLTADRYDGEMKLSNVSWYDRFMVRIDPKGERKWKWDNPRHEHPATEGGWNAVTERIKMTGYIKRATEGCRSKQKFTFLGDAMVFLKKLKEEEAASKEGTITDYRSIFYAAQSFRDAGYPDVAEYFYKLRAKMGGWCEEVYLSTLYHARNRFSKGKPQDKTVCLLLDAYNTQPRRWEAPFYLVRLWRLKSKFNLGWNFARSLVDQEPQRDALFFDADVHSWGFFEEAALCAYYAGDKKKFIELSKRVLACERTPEDVRKRTENNLGQFGK